MVVNTSLATRKRLLLLGVDGGGTSCRARLANLDGRILAEGTAGPANIRVGLDESLAAVREVTSQCLRQAKVPSANCTIVACLALAGACQPSTLTRAQTRSLPFDHAIFTSDARAACVGAHVGQDGGILIVGTGSIAWAIAGPREYRVGGWGFPISDEGSGAWLGCEALRRVLWAHDGVVPWTDLLQTLLDRFGADPHAVVRWMGSARPRDYAGLAPDIIAHVREGDAAACDLIRTAAAHIDRMAARLISLDVKRLSLMGGLAPHIEPFLSDKTQATLVRAKGDALSGALFLARAEAAAWMRRHA
jgi:glucosamine kinase